MENGHYLPAARKRQILDKTTNIISMLSHESMLFRCEKMNTLPPQCGDRPIGTLKLLLFAI
jgi:hypothetical protein